MRSPSWSREEGNVILLCFHGAARGARSASLGDDDDDDDDVIENVHSSIEDVRGRFPHRLTGWDARLTGSQSTRFDRESRMAFSCSVHMIKFWEMRLNLS